MPVLRIRNRRLEIGLSQEELAKKLGVNQTAISQWERGVALPSCEKLPEISKALCCKIDELFQSSQ